MYFSKKSLLLPFLKSLLQRTKCICCQNDTLKSILFGSLLKCKLLCRKSSNTIIHKDRVFWYRVNSLPHVRLMVLKCIENLFVNVHYRFWARANNTKSRHANTLKMQEKKRIRKSVRNDSFWRWYIFTATLCAFFLFADLFSLRIHFSSRNWTFAYMYTLILIVLQCLADVVGLCSFFCILEENYKKQ